MLLLFLVACTAAERILSFESNEPSDAEVWTPNADDTSGPFDPWDEQDAIVCGARNSKEWGNSTDALNPTFCLRLSPEPGSEVPEIPDGKDTGAPFEDTGITKPESGTTYSVPPPCGHFNLLGSISVQGNPEKPALMYCDADIPGGLRFVTVDGVQGDVRTQMLASESCYADPDTGTLFVQDYGWLVAWIDLQAGPGILYGHLGAQGEWPDEPVRVLFEGTPQRLYGLSEHLLVLDTENQLWSIPVVGDNIGGEPLFISSDVHSLGATPTDDGLAIATCGVDGGAPAVTRVQDNAVAWTSPLDGDCFFDARPSIAWQSDRLAMAWEQMNNGRAILLDGSGTVLTDLDLGSTGRYGTVVPLDNGFLLADGSGQLRALQSDGTVSDTWIHPDIAHHEGNIAGMRLTLTDEVWGFTLIGNDIVVTPAGHANTFYYLEVSAVPAP